MKVENSNLGDVNSIFELYRKATDYMKSKKQVYWPTFPIALVESEIREKRQWKISIGDHIACIWATTFNDELIWGKRSKESALYIHRIATSPKFRGQNFVQKIVDWAEAYSKAHDLKYIRMDTVGLNAGLIKHYEKHGFDFLGTEKLENTEALPKHYSEDVVCFFQREVKF